MPDLRDYKGPSSTKIVLGLKVSSSYFPNKIDFS
jgi:hypothetical protein